ncbi:MAG TPA: hypothetical protein VFH22_00485 [Rhodocyclaceae bacterium]|nr:hypothetical protein [Rhodocyclaceae bacterium]
MKKPPGGGWLDDAEQMQGFVLTAFFSANEALISATKTTAEVPGAALRRLRRCDDG